MQGNHHHVRIQPKWDLETKDFLPYFCTARQHLDSMDRLNSWDTEFHWGLFFQ